MKNDKNTFFFSKIHLVFVCLHFIVHIVEKSLNIAAVTFVSMVLHINIVAVISLMNG